jgi:hypothetical protein
MKLGRIVMFSSIILAMLAAPSAPHPRLRHDPNDVNFKTDVADIFYDHSNGRTFLRVGTHDPLQRAHLKNGNYVMEGLDTRRGDNIDFYIFMEYRSGPDDYFCFIFDSDEEFIRRVPANKRKSSIRCNFSSERVRGGAEHFMARSYFAGMIDVAPNSGLYVHWDGSKY